MTCSAITIIALFYTADLQPLLAAARGAAAGGVHGAGATPDQVLVAAAAVGVRRLVAGARLRGACHRCRGAARFRRPGPRPEGRGQGRRPARDGRTFRAPLAADLRRVRGPGVRVVLRRRRDRRAGPACSPRSPTRSRSASSPAWSSGNPSESSTATYLTSKLTRRPLQKGLTWPDLTGVAILGGIGFTVSLLIGELAFGGQHRGRRPRQDRRPHRLGRRRRPRRGPAPDPEPAPTGSSASTRTRDDDQDGIPDIYQK